MVSPRQLLAASDEQSRFTLLPCPLANGRMVERASVWWFHSYSPPLNDATRRRKLALHFVIVCALFTALLMALWR